MFSASQLRQVTLCWSPESDHECLKTGNTTCFISTRIRKCDNLSMVLTCHRMSMNQSSHCKINNKSEWKQIQWNLLIADYYCTILTKKIKLTCLSGTIIATVRNWTFRFSGSSCRPAYPGFCSKRAFMQNIKGNSILKCIGADPFWITSPPSPHTHTSVGNWLS